MTNYFPMSRAIANRMLGLAILALLLAGQIGCARSLRPDATKVAKAGSLTTKQLGEYYDALTKDNLRTWELFSFENAYDTSIILTLRKEEDARTPPTQDELDRRREADKKAKDDLEGTFKEYQARHNALIARKQLAHELQNLYESFTRLAAYDSASEVLNRVDQLQGTISTVIATPLPKGPTDLVAGILQDVIRHLRTVKQNKAILRGNNDIIAAITKLNEFYEAEKVVYKSIPTSRSALTVNVAKKLVTKKEVISAALLEDTLANYELKWPIPQRPFTDDTLIAGINGLINARAKPLELVSQDAADKLGLAIGKLIGLHQQLSKAPQTMSFEEFADSSATVQVLLAQLKEQNVPANALLDVLKTLLKEN